jgi:predicted acyl esterase
MSQRLITKIRKTNRSQRGHYRFSANKPPLYRFNLPDANHVFLPGHRIMVQVQSSWFPLYDRNPQTFVKNILLARPADYRKAVQHVYHAGTTQVSSSCR